MWLKGSQGRTSPTAATTIAAAEMAIAITQAVFRGRRATAGPAIQECVSGWKPGGVVTGVASLPKESAVGAE